MLAIISKLPLDLLDVRHILPWWFNTLYWLLWVAGSAFVIILVIVLVARFLKYLQSLPGQDPLTKAKFERRFTRENS